MPQKAFLNLKHMCLAIPGKIIEITAQLDDVFRTAKVSFGGIQKEINLCMVPDAQIGDYVLVHVGVAIGIIDEEEAAKVFNYLKDMGEVDELETADHSGQTFFKDLLKD